MFPKTKMVHRRYTGRFLPHTHTSYASLAFIVMLATVLVAAVTVNVSAYNYGDPNPGPFASSIGLSGKVAEPPPTQGAVITIPTNGQHFSATPITVSGTCPKATLVELYKNDIFAGASPCTDGGTFSVAIDLLYGNNALVARVYDVLDQAGPDSNTVNVSYDVLPPQQSPIDTSNLNDIQLLLHTVPVYRGIFPGQQFSVPIDVISGTPPFAITIDWGDNQTDLVSRPDNSQYQATHTYQRPGTYQVTVRASDAKGRQAYLTFVTIVNGGVQVLASSNVSPTSTVSRNALLLVWPLLIFLILLVLSFWLGERREKRKLQMRGQLVPQT